jgi:hypothetical protein
MQRQTEGVSRAPSSPHYQRALADLEVGDWAAAEGWLLQARLQAGPEALAVADALAYALLMQGDYQGCALVLEPVLEHPQRSFWIWHKYGDALRGLHQLGAAAAAYRRALAEGSTSALTARNLLQVLHEQAPELAVAELEHWALPLAPALVEGAQQAAALTAGLELAAWLQHRGLALEALQRRLTEQELYGLRWPAWLEPASGTGTDWLAALAARAAQLGLP